MSGVRVDHLCCPTCGEHYPLPLRPMVENEQEEFDIMQTTRPILERPVVPWRWYVVCPNGHKWTLKTLWRTVNHPDSVLLGEYIGNA